MADSWVCCKSKKKKHKNDISNNNEKKNWRRRRRRRWGDMRTKTQTIEEKHNHLLKCNIMMNIFHVTPANVYANAVWSIYLLWYGKRKRKIEEKKNYEMYKSRFLCSPHWTFQHIFQTAWRWWVKTKHESRNEKKKNLKRKIKEKNHSLKIAWAFAANKEKWMRCEQHIWTHTFSASCLGNVEKKALMNKK